MAINRRAGLALVALVALSGVFLFTVYQRLADTLTNPQRTERFVTGDSEHYLEMAEAFRDGRLVGMVTPAHRQPLYPALMAVGMASGADPLRAVGVVNATVGFATLLVLFGAGRWLFGSWWIGVFGGIAYAGNEFILYLVGERIMTEPVYVLVGTVATVAALKYLEDRRTLHLTLASGAAALAYLSRPNGLFLFAAMWATLLARDLLRRDVTDRRSLLRRYTLSLLVFVVIAAASWVPRTIVYGDPINHGYLSNYLWVDTYEEGHVGEAIYGPGDYFSSHGPGDVVSRLAWGVGYVFWTAPNSYGLSGLVFYLVAVLGLAAALAMRRTSLAFLALFMLLQLGPFVWTAMSNPTARVTYGALFPFLIIYVMMLAEAVGMFVRRQLA